MAHRIIKLTPGFARARSKLGIVAGTPRGTALGRCMTAIANSATLPGPADMEVEFRPGIAHARRAGQLNLWVWFRFDDDSVSMVSVTDEPPVPRQG